MGRGAAGASATSSSGSRRWLQREARQCQCGKSYGHYEDDDRTVEYIGPARVIGIDNHDFVFLLTYPDKEHRAVWFTIPDDSEWVKHLPAERADGLAPGTQAD